MSLARRTVPPLTEQQVALFERVLACTKYGSAVELLDEHRPLVDDAFLANVATMSQRLLTQGKNESAAAIADLGSVFDDLASVPTRIELRIAAGQAFARQLAQSSQGSIHAYRTAVEVAEAAKTPYMVPLAKFMLGQFARADGQLNEAIVLGRAAAVGALDPDSEVEPELFWNALALYRATLHQLDPHLSALEAMQSALALVPNQLLGEFRTRWQLPLSEDELLDRWAGAKARAGVVVEGVDPYDENVLTAFTSAIYKSLARREETDPGAAGRRVIRYSTNVLTDRIINQYPYFSTYVSRSALAKHLESLSILSHEFTHYWAFLGSLGGYFSAIALELRLLSEFVARPAAVEEVGASPARCAAAYHDARIKFRMLWETWRPWSEGLSLYAEMDLDLQESGMMTVPLTGFLAALPAFDTIVDADGDELGRRAAPIDPVEQFSEIEELQHKARARVLPTYRRSVYLGKAAPGNERCYFTGHGLVSALWRRWAESAPAFANSVVFFRALMWLTHSAFDDLIPDWRLPKEAFADALVRSFDGFLRRLFVVPGDRLVELAAVTMDTDSPQAHFDLWRHLRDGSRDEHAPGLWETRSTAVVREIAEAAFGDLGPDYVRFLADERAAILDGLLNASRVHMLSESDCEIRLVREPPTLVCVARSLQGGPAGTLVIRLSRAELDALTEEAGRRSDGAAQLHQFMLARRHAAVGFTYVFPVGVTFGQTFVLLSTMFRAGHGTVRVEDADQVLVRQFLDPDARAARDDIARIVEAADDEVTAAADLAAFADRIDRLYVSAFIDGPLAWIERLRNERLRAFLPASGSERSRIQDALDLVMREPGGIAIRDIAARMSIPPEQVTATLARFTEAAAVLGQDLIVREGDRIRFAGLRASRPPIT